MLRTIFVCMLFLGKFFSYGQVTISGKVVEKGTGESLPYATVSIRGTNIGVVTNVDGFFSLIDIDFSLDSLVLEGRFVGYNNQQVNIGALDELVIIELEPITDELEEVVVTANSYKVFDATKGISTTTLSTKQLSLLPSIGEPDIFRSLQMLPGVSSTSESSSGLFIRGSTPDQNLTLLDGMTVYKVDHFFGFFSAFNSNVIKDVRLYRGAFPARYGGRTSGVVELTGKTGSFEQTRGGINLSLLSIGGYVETPLSDKVSILLGGRRSYTEILKGGLYQDLIGNLTSEETLDNTLLEDATSISTEPDFYFYDLNGKISYRPSNKDMLTLSLYNGKDFLDESQEISDFLNDEVFLRYQLDERTDWGNKGASAKWSRQWGPKIYTSLLIAGTEYFSNYRRDEQVVIENSDSIVFDRDRATLENNSVIDLSVRGDVEWQISLKTKAEFGFAYTQNEIEYDNVRDDSVVLLSRFQKADYGSLYGSLETRLGEKLKTILGLRITNYKYRDNPLLEPRLNLIYDLLPKVKLKAAYGKHYQFTNQIVNQNISEGSREFWLLADEELIDVSSATHFIAGAAYQHQGWLVDVEAYYKDLQGLTEFSLQFDRGINESVEELFRTGAGSVKGMELLVQKSLGVYSGWISYTLSDIRNQFADLNDGFEFRPLHYQRHEFKMVHTYEVEGWNLALNFIYGSGNPFSEPTNRYKIELLDGRTLEYVGLGARNASFNPAYIRLDVSATYGFQIEKANAQLGLSLFNLLGRRNIWYTEYDFGQSPPLINQVTYLGFTPNLLFSINFGGK